MLPLYIYKVNPWAVTVERFSKEVIPKFISQAAAGYQALKRKIPFPFT